jgi:hypothetical protein
MLFILAITIIIIDLFSACKKGPDDPFISFRSRKDRLSGYWMISAATQCYGDSIITETDMYSNDGTVLISQGQSTFNGTYAWSYQINKDGTYTLYKNLYIPYNTSFNYTENGYWYFLTKNKSEHLKNKECVAFQPTQIVETMIQALIKHATQLFIRLTS